MPAAVDILLSVFNGEKYLPEQLESIAQQDFADWRLIVRDDGSKDSTLQIVESFKQKFADKVVLIKDNLGNLGFNKSFMELMKQATADYVMFCDHDDYWYPEKISTLLGALQNEGQNCVPGAELAFSDLQIADDKLSVISESFFKYIGYRPDKGNQIFFLKNYVPGCSIMFKQSLLQQVLKTENILAYHDHWVISVAAAINKMVCVSKPLMKYRTHGQNVVGVELDKKANAMTLIKDCAKYFLQNKKYRDILYSKNILQIKNICSVFPELVSKEAKAFSNVGNSNFFARKMQNMFKPYMLGRSFMEQLAYIVCF